MTGKELAALDYFLIVPLSLTPECPPDDDWRIVLNFMLALDHYKTGTVDFQSCTLDPYEVDESDSLE
jgi:hypothetical protein